MQTRMKAANPRVVVLVLGMHRSGTSAVTGSMVRLGLSAPISLMPAAEDNKKGFWEAATIANFHDELLRVCGSRWDDWRIMPIELKLEKYFIEPFSIAGDLYESEFAGTQISILKDPRVCRFAPLWIDLFQSMAIQPLIILPIRQPVEVARSLRTRNGFSLNKGMLLWLRYVLEAEYYSRGLPRSFVLWSRFLADWRQEIQRIGRDLNISWPRSPEQAGPEIDSFLTKELYRERVAEPETRGCNVLHDWISSTYQAMANLVGAPNATKPKFELDYIRSDFDAACKLFGPAFE